MALLSEAAPKLRPKTVLLSGDYVPQSVVRRLESIWECEVFQHWGMTETGYGGGEWKEYMVLSANPATHTNLTYTFLATGVQPLSTQHLEASEDIRIHLFTFEEVRRLLEENCIPQALMAAPLWRYVAEHSERR